MSGNSESSMLFANFNQDFSCVSVGTRKGYSITNCDPFGRLYSMNDGARGIVEMLFCTSLLALVGIADSPSSSPRKLQIVNTKRQSLICELLFPSSILAVKMNRKTLVIVLETEIYIYDISNMRLLHVIETGANPDAICALSPSADTTNHSYLAYPSPLPSPTSPLSTTSPSPSSTTAHQRTGDVMLFSTTSLTPTNVLRAHKSPISFLALSSSSSSSPPLLATSSDKGTVIRVWSVPQAEMLYQFRRGMGEARIWSLSFNTVSTLLVVSSEKETVHVFRLGRGERREQQQSQGHSPRGDDESVSSEQDFGVSADRKKSGGLSSSLRRTLTKTLTSSAGYLPSTLTEIWEPSRAFASLKLPSSAGGRNVVAISSSLPHVMVISSDGYFYIYSIDLENGGECVLIKQYSLLDSGEESSGMTE